MAVLLWLALLAPFQEKDKKKDPTSTKEAMQRIQLLVGEWRCTGEPDDTKQKSWTEKAAWNFKIEKEVYQIDLVVTDGVYIKDALLTYDLKDKVYRLVVTPPKGDTKKTYQGKLSGKELNLEQVVKDEETQERLVFNLLRDNRYLLTIESRPRTSKEWTELAVIGCTKEGVPFVKGGSGPVCIVTGGGAVLTSEYKGKTYYFC